MIPCKRPKVTVDPRTDADTFIVRCHVPRCGFQYPQDLQFHALKSDADGMATMHRRAHRVAVPEARVVKPTIDRPGYGATCACGWSVGPDRTRSDAQASIDHHLSRAHGVVSC